MKANIKKSQRQFNTKTNRGFRIRNNLIKMETTKEREIKSKKIAKQILKREIKIKEIAKQILRDLSHTDEDCIKKIIIMTGLWKILNYEHKIKEEENERQKKTKRRVLQKK